VIKPVNSGATSRVNGKSQSASDLQEFAVATAVVNKVHFCKFRLVTVIDIQIGGRNHSSLPARSRSEQSSTMDRSTSPLGVDHILAARKMPITGGDAIGRNHLNAFACLA
jgi:hypothetical protein